MRGSPEERRRGPRPASSVEDLERAAAAYVERYGGTRQRLRRALERRLDAESDPSLREAIPAIVERFAASGAVDDAAWAASRARRMVRRGVAPGVVRGRLGVEGVDGKAALATIEGDPTLLACCAYVRRRRMGAFRADRDDPTDLGRLGRAGFPYATARKVLGMERDAIEEVLRG